MRKNKIFSSLLAVAAVLCVSGQVAAQELNKVEAAPITKGTTFYLKPSDTWAQANARFAIYFYGGSGEKWYSMLDDDGDGIYEATASESHTNLIFCRMNPGNSTNNWNNKWNQSGDLTWDGTNNLFTPTEGWWDTMTDTWSTLSYDVKISLNGGDWNSIGGLSDANNDNIYETEVYLPRGKHEFKVTIGDKYHGTNKTINDEVTNLAINAKDASSSSNIKFNANGGNYKISYNVTNDTISVDHLDNPQADLKATFDYYYNNGYYNKHTEINVKRNTTEEVKGYFHAGISELVRDTVYEGDSLTMTIPGNETYSSTYGTNEEGMPHYSNGSKTPDYTVKGTSMEEYYVTLYDIKNVTDGWTYANNVYTSTAATDINNFRLFTAPLWLKEDSNTQNYIDYTHVTVHEENGELVMRLYVSTTEYDNTSEESGKITNAEGIFSEARITLPEA